MATQKRQRRGSPRTPYKQSSEKKRHERSRNAHRTVRRIGAHNALELAVLATASKPEGEV